MPIFEFVCHDCAHRFELIVRGGATEPSCPACQGRHLEKQLSVFAVGSRGSASPSPSGACGSCGDPRGPGACSLN